MAAITFKGNKVNTSGNLPVVGVKAPDFKLTRGNLADVGLAAFSGKVKILNIVPSLDTGVCAASARVFNKAADGLEGVVVLTVCEAEGIKAVVPLSELRDRAFGASYGAEMLDGPLAGLLSRAVVVIGKDDRVVYTQQVAEIGQEPDYASALAAAKKSL
jgi:thiol peroxidase